MSNIGWKTEGAVRPDSFAFVTEMIPGKKKADMNTSKMTNPFII